VFEIDLSASSFAKSMDDVEFTYGRNHNANLRSSEFHSCVLIASHATIKIRVGTRGEHKLERTDNWCLSIPFPICPYSS
jgi:hypothetical protein